jgi:hypothetical protein
MRVHTAFRLLPPAWKPAWALAPLAVAALSTLPLAGSGAGSGIAAAESDAREAKNTIFVNHKVSSRTVSVNQAVRLEFTSMPRQIEGIEVAAAVANGIAITGGRTWRLTGKPLVTEAEKTKTITVVVSLLPRTTGDLALPNFPLTWLTGEPRPDFGVVSISQTIAIAGETKPLPPEYDGVGGLLWGARQDDLLGKQIPVTAVTAQGERTSAKLSGSLEVGFRGGELADATLLASGLTLEQARASFCDRWGLPASEDASSLTWVLGWTRITATPSADGVKVELMREDIQAKQAAGQVKARVFNLLEGVK